MTNRFKPMQYWYGFDQNKSTLDIVVEHDIRQSYSRSVRPFVDKAFPVALQTAVAEEGFKLPGLSWEVEATLESVDHGIGQDPAEREAYGLSGDDRALTRYIYLIQKKESSK